MYCKNCGKEVESNSKFCSFCKAELEHQDEIIKHINKDKSKISASRQKKKFIILEIAIVGVLILTGCMLKGNAKVKNISKKIELGNQYLKESKYQQSQSAFQEAIALDKDNKQIYIEIRDIYLQKERIDDALSILKLATINGVNDSEIINSIEEVKKKLGVTNLDYTIYQMDEYKLPESLSLKINNEDTDVSVKWNHTQVDTSKVGSLTFEGMVDKYERKVKATLKIVPKITSIKDISAKIIQGETYILPKKLMAIMSDKSTKEVLVKWNPASINNEKVGVQSFKGIIDGYEKGAILKLTVDPKSIKKMKQIGYVKRVYDNAGNWYLEFDVIQFLTGDAAVEAAKKDGNAVYEDGEYYVTNDYYIVNDSEKLKTYGISKKAALSVLGIDIDPYGSDIYNSQVPFEKFKYIVNSDDYGSLCYIYTENDVVVKVERQFVP